MKWLCLSWHKYKQPYDKYLFIINIISKYIFTSLTDKDTPLTDDILYDPQHPITQLMLTIYSLECFVYKSLNAGHRFGDKSKIDSLGPYAQVMDTIVN
jgi:hypothetical protein